MKNLSLLVEILCLCVFILSDNNLAAQSRNQSKTKTPPTAQPAASPRTQSEKELNQQEGGKKVDPMKDGVDKSSSAQTKSKSTGTTAIWETPASTEALFNNLFKNALPVIEDKPNGQINWTEQYIEAKGQSVIDYEKFKNPAQARLMATRGAIVVAQRNLLEILKGVHITGESTVQDMITQNDYIHTRIEGVVKGAQQVGAAREINGYVEVTMRVPIYGNKGIAGAFNEAELRALKQRAGIPETITHSNESIHDASGNYIIDGSRPFIFNFRNQQFDPSMFPVIVDEKGNVVLDFSKWYDFNSGKFPQYLQLSKEILQETGVQKGVDIIELVQKSNGQFTISPDSKKRVVWQKIGNVAQKIGKVLFSVL